MALVTQPQTQVPRLGWAAGRRPSASRDWPESDKSICSSCHHRLAWQAWSFFPFLLNQHMPPLRNAPTHAQVGVPIATEKKTTNLVRNPDSSVFCLLETRLRGPNSRSSIREWLSRIKSPRDHVVSPEGLEASRLPSFARTARTEDRCFFLRCYRNPRSRCVNRTGEAPRAGGLAARRGLLCPFREVTPSWLHLLRLDTIPQVESGRARWLRTGRRKLGRRRLVSSKGPLFCRDHGM